MIDLEAIRVLLTVIETGSVKAAARDLALSRNTVRRKIEELEARVGARLLVRDGAGAAPTPAGRALASRARPLLEEAAKLLEHTRGLSDEAASVLRLSGPSGLPAQGIALMHAAMRVHDPRIRIELTHCERPVERLSEGAELALTFEHDLELGDVDCEVLEMATLRERLLGSPEYLARHPPIERTADLEGHTLFVWQAPDSIRGHLPTLDGELHEVGSAVVMNEIAGVRGLASQGLGLCYAPCADAGPLADYDGLVPVLPKVFGVLRPARIVVPRALLEVPKVRALMEFHRAMVAAMASS